LLRSAIAKERLPLDILDWDIEGVLEMGVQAETGKALGKDFTIDSLLEQGFETVFLATGGWDSRLTRDKGKGIETPVPGSYLLVDLLRTPDKIDCHEDVVITGGGKSVLDAVRILKERGAKKITVLFRETWEDSPITDEDVKALGDEGLTIQFGVAVTRLFGEGDTLSEIEYVELESKAVNTIPLGTLIIPAGRFPELIFKPEMKETETESEAEAQKTGRWEARESYKQPAFSDQVGLLAAGDAQTDYSAAIRAIGAGRRSAASIHQVMYDIEPGLPEDVIIQESVLQNVDHVEHVGDSSRNIMPLRGPKELAEFKEIEKGFSENVAKDEASRCLQCGLICYERRWSEMEKPEGVEQTA
jgi:formate dehydrogenase beta subunit